jgi:hypothetical protein
VSALQQEQAKTNPPQQRGDLGGAKPLSKVNLVHDPPRPAVQVNPAKPPKRAMQFDDDGASQQRPAIQRNPPSYQQIDAKRRKTDEEDQAPEQERRSVMAPPVRYSNIKKVSFFGITIITSKLTFLSRSLGNSRTIT